MPELPASVRVAAWVTHAWAGGVTLTEAVERALPDVDHTEGLVEQLRLWRDLGEAAVLVALPSPGDLAGLGPLQRDLLRAGIEATRPGGVIAYATCSPHLSETTFVVRDVLKKRDDVEVLDARELLAGTARAELTGLGDGPHAQLWPHVHGTDAMFMALFTKTS